jgi:poly [ADP-ribose] polymerase
MPLGKLSKGQIAKGFEILEEIEAYMKSKTKSKTKIYELSSKFYTAIPQDFGRQRPPPIDTEELLQKKYDMLVVLSDIELAQTMQENAEKENQSKKESGNENDAKKQPHPIDVNYDLLKCGLEIVDKASHEYKVIDTYTKNTKGYQNVEIINVWKVDREEEVCKKNSILSSYNLINCLNLKLVFKDKRFQAHDPIENRKLLWHGTNVAVVAAILKTGLRIMPHSGGRVGRGIYFASENGKSAGYVGTTSHKSKRIGIMFLNEVALGKEHYITHDDPSLVQPPNGYDCVIAKGNTEPGTLFLNF